ncbi:hypothetical protein EI94DRAFT_1809860 [Lactarius quietus]|nr:hypothetical protein EI94DRAFT_1809860 [Lactarius quietus]
MYHHADPTTFSYSETSSKNFQVIPPANVPLSSQSPFRFSSLDTTESGSISSTGSSPDIPSHTITGYNYPHRSSDRPPWTYAITGDQYGARSPPLESSLDISFAPSSYIDDAKKKLGEGVHRWCFNCRATETTTWRRLLSVLENCSAIDAGFSNAHIIFRVQRSSHAEDGHDPPPYSQPQLLVVGHGNSKATFHQPCRPHNIINPLMPSVGNQSHKARHG